MKNKSVMNCSPECKCENPDEGKFGTSYSFFPKQTDYFLPSSTACELLSYLQYMVINKIKSSRERLWSHILKTKRGERVSVSPCIGGTAELSCQSVRYLIIALMKNKIIYKETEDAT